MQCYKIILSSAQSASGTLGKIQDEFMSLFMAKGGPKEMAMFSSRGPDDTIIYFINSSSVLIEPLAVAYNGEVCNQLPSASSVVLSVGHNDAVSLLPA
jgi:hypothetical protein